MYLIMMGVQGAGKGTQAAVVKEHLNIPHITSGGLFRAMKNQDTPLARQVQAIMERGDLVPDDITIQIVKERITQEDARNGFILDGFPRTRPQAEALDALMAELGYDRYVAQGGDWGSLVSQGLGVVDPAHCAGIHVNMIQAPPPKGAADRLVGGNQGRCQLLETRVENGRGRRRPPVMAAPQCQQG